MLWSRAPGSKTNPKRFATRRRRRERNTPSQKEGSAATKQDVQNDYVQANKFSWPTNSGHAKLGTKLASDPSVPWTCADPRLLAADRQRPDADQPEGSLGGSIDPCTDISRFSKSAREFYKKYGILKYSFGFRGRGISSHRRCGLLGDVCHKRGRGPTDSSSVIRQKTREVHSFYHP